MSRSRRRSVATRGGIAAIRGYQVATRWMQPRCRYWPSCSQYALEAIEEWGLVRGSALGLRRLGRCHPWASWGHDPVPLRANRRSPQATGSGVG